MSSNPTPEKIAAMDRREDEYVRENDPAYSSIENRIVDAQKQIQFTGRNLVETLHDYTSAGGDVHSAVQALELFVRAVIQEILARAEILK